MYPKHNKHTRKPAQANTKYYTLVWYAFMTSDHETEQALFLQPRSMHEVFNPLKHSGIRYLHFEVFSAIHI